MSLAGVLLAMALQALSQEAPSLTAFKEICVAHNAGETAAESALAARGWREIDSAALNAHASYAPARGFAMHWTSQRAWVPAEADSALILLLGEGPVGQGAAVADFCMVAGQTPFAQQNQAVRAWLGFASAQSWGPGGESYFAQRSEDAALSNAVSLSEDEVRALLPTRTLAFVQVVGNAQVSALNYSALRPVTPQ